MLFIFNPLRNFMGDVFSYLKTNERDDVADKKQNFCVASEN